ncbi:stimulator of interferon genes protein-like isoform X2 [Tachypleus tridentatus]
MMMMMVAVSFANIFYKLLLLIKEMFHHNSRHQKSFQARILFDLISEGYVEKILMLSFVPFIVLLICNQDVLYSLWAKHGNTYFSVTLFLPIIFYFRLTNNVEVDQIREQHRLCCGYTLAHWYYYGYLRIVLRPGVGLTLKDRMKQYEDHHHVTIPVKKLLLLLPESCLVYNNLEQHGDDNVQCAQELPPLTNDIAGTSNRNYKNTVYEIITGSNKSVRCCVEGVPTLLTLREICDASNKGPSPIKLEEELNNFCNELTCLLEADPGCANSYELIRYKDIIDGQQVPLSTLIWKKIGECLVRERRSA